MPPPPSTSTPNPRTLHNMTCSATDAGRRCTRPPAAGSAYCDLHAPLTDAAELFAAYFSDDMPDDEESFVPFPMVGGTPETALEALRQWKAHPPASPPPQRIAKSAKRSAFRTRNARALPSVDRALACVDQANEKISAEPAPPPSPEPQPVEPPATEDRQPANPFVRRHCQALNKAGAPCGFPPNRGSSYCLNHQPGVDLQANSARAVAGKRLARLQAVPTSTIDPFMLQFENRMSIQVALDTAIRLHLAGRISATTAGLIVRAASVAARNFDPPRQGFGGYDLPVAHKPEGEYSRQVFEALQTVDALLWEAEEAKLDPEQWDVSYHQKLLEIQRAASYEALGLQPPGADGEQDEPDTAEPTPTPDTEQRATGHD